MLQQVLIYYKVGKGKWQAGKVYIAQARLLANLTLHDSGNFQLCQTERADEWKYLDGVVNL